MYRRAIALPLLAGVAMAGGGAAAFATEAPPPAAAYAMPDTEVFDLTAADDGQVYRIFISKPSQPAPPGGFPVLYVLDANALFPGFAGERRIEEFGKMASGATIVVGIGYPTEQAYEMQRRLYDLTPAWPAAMPLSTAAFASLRAGGSQHFARFLTGQLREEIAKRYAVAAGRQSLFGHSLGGLFALHMFYSQPTAFEAVIAASPSQWWNDQDILAEERAFTARLTAGKIAAPIGRLMLLTGEREDMVSITWDAQALFKRLEPLSAYGLRTSFTKLEGEQHLTVPYRSMTQVMRFVAGLP